MNGVTQRQLCVRYDSVPLVGACSTWASRTAPLPSPPSYPASTMRWAARLASCTLSLRAPSEASSACRCIAFCGCICQAAPAAGWLAGLDPAQHPIMVLALARPGSSTHTDLACRRLSRHDGGLCVTQWKTKAAVKLHHKTAFENFNVLQHQYTRLQSDGNAPRGIRVLANVPRHTSSRTLQILTACRSQPY